MTRDQLGACIALGKEGFYTVAMPTGPDTPIPGRVLLADMGHRKLLLIECDGTAVDLFAVNEAAADTTRHWRDDPQVGDPLPSFVGDFARLTKLAQAVNGRKIKTETSSP